jgi:hypothetical protein
MQQNLRIRVKRKLAARRGDFRASSSPGETCSVGRCRRGSRQIIIGFASGGWVTGGTSATNAGAAAQSAVVQAFVPLCVASADQQPDQLAPLKAASAYSRYELVIKAGWVANVAEKYRRSVAESCATVIVEAMDAAAAKRS